MSLLLDHMQRTWLIYSEFNYYRSKSGACVLVDGAAPLSISTQEEQCDGYTEFWYERTAYRKIPYSSCVEGERPDRGKQHACPGLIGGGGVGAFFWGVIAIIPFAMAGLAGYWWYSKGGAGGYVISYLNYNKREGMLTKHRSIRLDEHRAFGGDGVLSTVASIPIAIIGATSAAWGWVTRRVPYLDGLFGSHTPYRSLPIDDDAGESFIHDWN